MADYGYRDRPAKHVSPITFVGGTGRSGTHIVARFLGRHTRVAAIGVECRFHVEERGFPGLLDGSVSRDQFLKRLRGFWWRGRISGRDRGMFRFLPEDRFEAAASTFEESFDPQAPDAACRRLFLDLLWPYAAERKATGLVEQSCDTVAESATLLRLFPEAKFVHVVRDGRDASASRVSQTRGIVYPRTRNQGIQWFERRIRGIEEGARQIPEAQLLQVSLEELLSPERFDDVRALAEFVSAGFSGGMRRFFGRHMSAGKANTERWRVGISERRQESLDAQYRESLERLEADGVSSVPLLRRSYERLPELSRPSA
jgi:hypothetical protein